MTSNPSHQLINDIEALLATSARLFASDNWNRSKFLRQCSQV